MGPDGKGEEGCSSVRAGVSQEGQGARLRSRRSSVSARARLLLHILLLLSPTSGVTLLPRKPILSVLPLLFDIHV